MLAFADEPPCEGAQLATAKSSLSDAKAALDRAIAAIDHPSAADLARQTTWLGLRSSSEAAAVRDKLVRSKSFLDGVVFLCAVKTDVKIGDVYAYVRPDNSFAITLGHFFFIAPQSGYSSKVGVLVHEISHFLLSGATKDPIIYGTEEAKRLAISKPVAAQSNAENIEYFVESVVFNL
jgi:hypothetical protein